MPGGGPKKDKKTKKKKKKEEGERTLGSKAAKVQGESETAKYPSVLAIRRLMLTLVRAVGEEDQKLGLRVNMR